MAWGRWLQPTNLNKSQRSIKGSGDFLPPSPPAEKATASQDQAWQSSTGAQDARTATTPAADAG